MRYLLPILVVVLIGAPVLGSVPAAHARSSFAQAVNGSYFLSVFNFGSLAMASGAGAAFQPPMEAVAQMLQAAGLTPQQVPKDVFLLIRGSFGEKVRGMIRYEVAKADGCPLCREGYRDLLRMYGLTDEEIWLLDKEIRETKYDEKTKNLLIFAYAAASQPHQEPKTVEAFTRLGLSAEELVEVSTMVHFERALLEIVHSLGVH